MNAATSWGLSLVQALIGVLLVPFLISCLGAEGYGLVSLATVVVTIASLAELGLRGALTRQLTEQIAKDDVGEYNALASTAFAVYLALATAAVGVLLILAEPLVAFFRVPEDLKASAITVVRVYGTSAVATSFLGAVFGAVITSTNRFDVLNALTMAVTVLQGIGLFLLLGPARGGIVTWSYVMAVSQVGTLAARWALAHRIHPCLALRYYLLRSRALPPLFSLAGKMFVFQITELISTKSDPIIITRFFGPAGVAIYNPGLVLASLGRQFVDTIRSQLHPLATKCFVSGEQGALNEILFRGTRYTILLGIPVCVVLGVFAPTIMRIWLGSTPIADQYHVAAWVLLTWALVDLFNYAAGSQWPILLGMNRLTFLATSQSIAAFVNIAASAYLAGYTRLGIVGVVIPTAVIAAIRRPIMLIYISRVCGIPAKRYLREAYRRPLIVCVVMTVAVLGLRLAVAPNSLFMLGACAVISGAVWVPLCWHIGLEESDRESLRDLGGRICGRVALRFI